MVRGNVAKELATLKREGNGNIFVFGSANLSKDSDKRVDYR